MLLLLAVLVFPARADTIFLKNGNELEGIVQRESRAEVVLDLGFGTMSLQKSDIARIKRSSPKQRRILQQEQRRKFFDSGRWVPKTYGGLFTKYKELGAAREAAMEAKGRRDAMAHEQAGLATELPRLEGRGRYDCLLRLQEIGTLLPLAERDMQAYLSKYKAFEEDWAAAAKAETAEELTFREQLSQALAEMSRDFEKEQIVSRREGDHLIVQAMIDGRVPATFLVDTGATLTTLSPQVAARLTPLIGTESEGVSTVADGRRTKVRTFEVATLEIGRSKQDRVRIAVMPSPGRGLDGLLGMSFLQHFAVEMDTPGGKLFLNRLK